MFIELEKPQSRFFREDSNNFHSDFTQALQQINQWRAWFDRGHQSAFLASVRMIQVPQHMAVNPTYNKYVLVFGRRSEYIGNEVRRSLVRAQARDDLKIITFDSLAENIERKHEVSIGIRHNEFVDIITNEITDSGLYAWVEPTQLRVSKTLHSRLTRGAGSNWPVPLPDGGWDDACKYASTRVLVRSD